MSSFSEKLLFSFSCEYKKVFTGKRELIKTVPEEAQMLNLLDQDLKLTILNIFKALKETMSKELKEIMKMMYHHLKNINKETIIKNKQIEILE